MDGNSPLRVKVDRASFSCGWPTNRFIDGQVTVWDHRSSRSMAVFHTSSDHKPSSPLTQSSPANQRTTPGLSDVGAPYEVHAPNVVLIDPVTGASRSGGSTSGKEAARVVKFSPEGSSRDLMVFSEVSLCSADMCEMLNMAGKLEHPYCRRQDASHACRPSGPVQAT